MAEKSKIGKEKNKKKHLEKRKTKLSLNKKEVEDLIVKLYREGKKPELIGMILRDTYGIGDVKSICRKKIVKILREKGVEVFPSDLEALIEKVKNLKKHMEKNKKDYRAKRALQILESRIRILTNYYKRKGILAKNYKPAI